MNKVVIGQMRSKIVANRCQQKYRNFKNSKSENLMMIFECGECGILGGF